MSNFLSMLLNINRSIIFCFFLFAFSKAESQSTLWSTNPYDQKVFIENKGQFDGKINSDIQVLFGTSQYGTEMFWTAKGLTYRVTEHYLSPEARREMEKGSEQEKNTQIRYHSFRMEWMGANPAPEVITEERVSNYFTYSNTKDKSGKSGIKAFAYKKITYKNIYPGIDAQYVLPEKGGIKYSLIVHPGADPAVIKMRYTGTDKTFLNTQGEIEIKSTLCGNYSEHQPETYSNGTLVPSAFSMQGSTIGFSIPSYDKSKTLVIDPWVSVVNFPAGTNPSTTAWNTSGYALGYDNGGNVWVYGGADPVYLAKYSSGGALLWSFQVPFSAWDLVGDFDVNKVTGTTYICAGSDCTPANPAGIAAGVVKVNAQGIQTGRFNGNNKNYEISRIRLDCSGRLYMTGGGVPNNSLWQVAGLDTNLTTMTGRHTTSSPNGDHDESLMCMDPSGNFMYVNFNQPAQFSADFLNDNEMQKIPLPGFTPTTWINPGPIHHFVEMGSLTYSGIADGGMNPPSLSGRINIFNGMVCGNNFLYSYNGDTLKQWNKNTGTLIKEIRTGGTAYLTGGLDLDLCENVYAGIGNQVKKYDANLNLLTTIALPNTTSYDLKVDNNRNYLYACGKGYVCAIMLGPPPTKTLTTSVTPSSCTCTGTAAATYTINTSCGVTFTYSYQWFPGGQTTPSVTGLCPGTYTVIGTASLNCLNNILDTGIVTITGGGSLTATISPPVTICAGSTASLSATGGGTYSWSNGSVTSAITVSPSGTTTYSCTVSNGGCSSTVSQTVTVNNFVVASIAPPPPICIGNSLTLTASGGTAYTWNTGALTPSIVITPTASSTYSVIVSSGTTCIDSATVNVIVNPLPVPTISPNTTICLGSSTQFTAGGGTSYSWNNGSTSNPLVVTPPAGSSTYSVIVTDANGCTATTNANVFVNPIPTPTLTGDTLICLGESTTLTAGGGVTYAWSNGQTTQVITVTPAVTTNYSVTVMDAIGCSATAVIKVTVLPPPVAAFTSSLPCLGSTSQLNDGSIPAQGDPILSWNWTMTGGTPASSSSQNPSVIYTTAGSHTVTLIVTSKEGCTDTLNQQVVIYNNPIALFSERDSGCAPICVDYSDASQAVDGSITGWIWSFPGGSPSSSSVPNPGNICYKTPGSYGASLIVSNTYGCMDTIALSNIINAYPTPSANFCVAPTKASATDPVFTFCDLWTGGVTGWTWDFGDGSALDSTSTDPTHSYSLVATGNDFYSFTVILTVENQYGCKDTISKVVELLPEFTFYIPNSFTPNGDYLNSLFYGKGRGIKEYDIWLFDRWGNMIWNCHKADKNTNWDNLGQEGLSSDCRWDGRVKPGGADMSGSSNELVQEDVYVWKVKLTDIFEKKHTYVGHVSVLR